MRKGGECNAIFSPDGNQILTKDKDNILKLWDYNTGNILRSCKTDDGYGDNLVFSPNGKYFAFRLSYTLYLYNSHTFSKIFEHEINVPSLIYFAPNSSYLLFTNNWKSTKYLIDENKIEVMDGAIVFDYISPHNLYGAKVISGPHKEVSDSVNIYDIASNRLLGNISSSGDYNSNGFIFITDYDWTLVILNNYRDIIITSTEGINGSIGYWDSPHIYIEHHLENPGCCAASLINNSILIMCYDNIFLLNISIRKIIKRYKSIENTFDIVLHPSENCWLSYSREEIEPLYLRNISDGEISRIYRNDNKVFTGIESIQCTHEDINENVNGLNQAIVRSGTTVQDTQEKRIEMTKQERIEMYQRYLAEEGYVPKKSEDNEFILFKFEGMACVIFIDEDEGYFRIVSPGFWTIESDEEREKAIHVAHNVNISTKVANVFPLGESASATIEMFCYPPEVFKAVFQRSLNALKAVVVKFVEEMQK